MKSLNKIIRVGTIPVRRTKRASVFCKVNFDAGRLSISGVIGPRLGGNADGGCGQICVEFAHRNPADDDSRYSSPVKPEGFEFAPGWDADKWITFLDIWEKWHLNDMRAGCEHQRGPEWEGRDITLYHFRLQKSIVDRRRAAEKRAVACLKAGEVFTPTLEEVRVSTLPDKLTLDTGELSAVLAHDYEPNGPQYDKDHYTRPSEVKRSNWVRPDEHPAGLLCKPCPVCGYKYGTEWKSESVPAEVVEFLERRGRTTHFIP